MPRFHYEAIDADGRLTSGEREAADVTEAAARLEADGLTVRFVRLIKDASGKENSGSHPEAEQLRTRDFHRLSGQLGELTEAGLPLVQGLSALAEELPSSRFRRGLNSIVGHLQRGGDLASVLEQHGAPSHLQALVAAGVRSGQTGELLGRYAAQSRQAADIKLRAAMSVAYPVIVLILLVVLQLAVLIWIVPGFAEIYGRFGTEISALTQLLIWVSDVVVNHWLWLSLGLVVLAAGIWAAVCFGLERTTRRRLLCKIPVIGRPLRFGALAHFSQLLAILIESGVPLSDALTLAGEGSDDVEIEAATWVLAADLERGEPLDRAAWNMLPVLPATLVEAMTWHDQPDVFAEMLRSLAELFETQSRSQSAVIVALWQPVAIVIIGISVGTTVLALFLPMLKLLNDLS